MDNPSKEYVMPCTDTNAKILYLLQELGIVVDMFAIKMADRVLIPNVAGVNLFQIALGAVQKWLVTEEQTIKSVYAQGKLTKSVLDDEDEDAYYIRKMCNVEQYESIEVMSVYREVEYTRISLQVTRGISVSSRFWITLNDLREIIDISEQEGVDSSSRQIIQDRTADEKSFIRMGAWYSDEWDCECNYFCIIGYCLVSVKLVCDLLKQSDENFRFLFICDGFLWVVVEDKEQYKVKGIRMDETYRQGKTIYTGELYDTSFVTVRVNSNTEVMVFTRDGLCKVRKGEQLIDLAEFKGMVK
jgi:hypothetical protein